MNLNLKIFLASLFSISLAFVALMWVVADFKAQISYKIMDAWSKDTRIIELREWRVAYLNLAQSRRLNPFSVDYIIAMAQLFEWSSTALIFESDRQRALLEAKRFYMLAASKRPTWPHTWASIVHVSSLTQTINDETYSAASRAIEYGPWIKESQKKVFIFSFHNWVNIPNELKTKVLFSIGQWLINGDREMTSFILKTAVRFNTSFLIKEVLEEVEFANEHNKTKNKLNTRIEQLKRSKQSTCKQSDCVYYPVKRFKEKFEI